MKLIKFAAAALLALSSLSASAALISIVDNGSTAYAPDVAADLRNDFTKNGYVTPATYTIAGSLQANTKLSVTYYFLGQESSWDNSFTVGAETLSLSNKGSITTYVEKDALFDFTFSTHSPSLSVTNAEGSTLGVNNRVYSFAVALNAYFSGQGKEAVSGHKGNYDAILFLDDTGPITGDDDNHDDLLIGIRVTAVPEPTTLLLMSMGLLNI
jgi:hypothetical protein